MPEPAPQRIIVFGEQRSGTRLLCELLDRQPGVRVAGGYLALFLRTAFVDLGLSADAVPSRRQRHVLLQRAQDGAPPGCSLDALPSRLTVGAMHAALLRQVSPAAQWVGHKAHGPLEGLLSLAAAPDLRLIALVRDPRDVMLSRAYRGETQLDEAIASWCASSATLLRERAHPRLLCLRFEDLVSRPRDALPRLARFVGLPSIVVPAPSDGAPALQNSAFRPLTATLDAAAVGRYRGYLDEPILRFVQWRAGPMLRAFGYGSEPRLAATVAERAHFLRRRLTLGTLALPRRAKNAFLSAALPSLLDRP